MNSKERHEARYQRRKARRQAKAAALAERYTDFDELFGFPALVEAFQKCKKGVLWKASVQAYKANLIVNSENSARRLRDGAWKSRGFHEFDIIERGKHRHIQSVHISERCIQRALCDNCLVPILRQSMIYDNGACLEGKGTDFALDRFTQHLRDHVRKYGRTGGIYFFDFSNYFGNIQNAPLVEMVQRKVMNEQIMKIYEKFVYAFGETGLGLGSQISQISAIFYPGSIDHLIKDKLGMKYYGRYMDDGYIICPDIDKLKHVAGLFERECTKMGIRLNRNKCRIIRLHKQFSFLKIRFFVTETGRVVRRIGRHAVKKERHRLRRFKNFLHCGKMSLDHICNSFYAWLRSLKRGRSYHIKMNMIEYFNQLYREEGVYFVQAELRRRHPVYRKCVLRAQAA